MRILFGANPATGHVLPLLPLADAAAEAGHDVAFLTASSMTPHLGGRRLLAAGPPLPEVITENLRRVGSARTLGPGAAELLAGTRVDLTWDEALAEAARHEPDLLVGEELDVVIPLLAAHLDVPWAEHAVCAPMPPEFTEPFRARADGQHASRALKPRDRLAVLDPFPDSLRRPADTAVPPDRIPIRPDGTAGQSTGHPVPPRPEGMPRALVTMGTSVNDPALVSAIAESVAKAGFDVLVTAAPDRVRTGPRVHAIGFTPLRTLLPEVDVVIGAAGTGTLLATLAAGVPTVLYPVLADQPSNAARAEERGAARTIADATWAGAAARRVFEKPSFGRAAREVAAEIAAMNSPAQALTALLARHP
ncbi:glycosyltransferase [Amycolatopsis sp. OK19-0408]|uniref:Glycosyltransferase n=1 Tax=Amycolatopsis iheyensis TaxID=2945988 RepID=A0A9X2NL46_9PSEU|nr:nucleotide disphospho-sugar-binding domain-containing protein [Amycolatopsis iheyensis]MCR6488780.1 glycosyltransferase [Amycolatopsis iheyensis]